MRYGLENIIRLVSQEGKHMALSNVESEWLETTPGERFKIQTSSRDAGGAYLILELKAAPRIGVPVHTHDKRRGALHHCCGHGSNSRCGQDPGLPSCTSVTVGKRIPHAWCNLTGSLVRFIVIFTPGRIEGLFGAVAAKKVDDVKAFASSYGTRIIGPAMHPGLNNIFTPAPRQTKD
jgi:hypothetical protein